MSLVMVGNVSPINSLQHPPRRKRQAPRPPLTTPSTPGPVQSPAYLKYMEKHDQEEDEEEDGITTGGRTPDRSKRIEEEVESGICMDAISESSRMEDVNDMENYRFVQEEEFFQEHGDTWEADTMSNSSTLRAGSQLNSGRSSTQSLTEFLSPPRGFRDGDEDGDTKMKDSTDEVEHEPCSSLDLEQNDLDSRLSTPSQDSNPRPRSPSTWSQNSVHLSQGDVDDDDEASGTFQFTNHSTLPEPPPPPPCLLLTGDHTSSSTTDSLLPKSPHPLNRNGGGEGGGGDLMLQIQMAARKMSSQREEANSLARRSEVSVNESWKEAERREERMPAIPSFCEDLKSVITERQRRSSVNPVEFLEILQSRGSSYYNARIGMPAEDTELATVFLRRASQARFVEQDDSSAVEGGKSGKRGIETGENSSVVKEKVERDLDEQLNDSGQEKETSEQDEVVTKNCCDEGVKNDKKEESPDLVTPYDAVGQLEEETVGESFQKNADGGSNPDWPDYDTQFNRVVEDLDQIPGMDEPERESLNSQGPSNSTSASTDSDQDDQGYGGSLVPTSAEEDSPLPWSPVMDQDDDNEETPVFEAVDAVRMAVAQERSKLTTNSRDTHQILDKILTPPRPQAAVKNESTKSGFKLFLATFRKSLGIGRRKKMKPAAAPMANPSSEDGSEFKFDDNWSIVGTIRERSTSLQPESSRSLKDAVENFKNQQPEMISFSEYAGHSERDAGKDFSVRNWKELFERSNSLNSDDVTSSSSNLSACGDTESGSASSQEVSNFKGFLRRRAYSSPDLGLSTESPSNDASRFQPFSTTTTTSHGGNNSLVAKRARSSKTRTEMEDWTSMDSQLRQVASSPGINSTLPSRRNRGMIQSFDSIIPPSTHTDQRRYIKKSGTEHRKSSLPSKGGSFLLSPVLRRQQRSLLAKR